VLVQVRHGREDHQREALTIGITRQVDDGTADTAAPGITHAADAPAPAPAAASDPDLVVTVGEQQWFNANQVGWPALGSLIGVLFTPWALFGLLWLLSRTIQDHFLPNDVWTTIDNFVLTQDGTLVETTDLRHPHGASDH
jgi:hypothetical protein